MDRRRATLAGFGAVLLWSLLATLTSASAPVPPFQLTAMSFAIGGGVGLVWIARSPQGFGALRGIPAGLYLAGTLGIFGYHFLYFTALRLAPPAQAGLIAYLWPLLIVLFSGLLPGERLRGAHIVGALLAFGGAALVLRGPDGFALSGDVRGYLAALACAVIWAAYSVLSRRAGEAPTQTVVIFCLATAGAATLAHLGLETTRWPADARGWLAILALGLGPVGLAFYIWDAGMKRGDIQLLGIASYAAPLLSTALLVATGFARFSLSLLLAAVLIAAGAALAAWSGREGK